MLERSPRWRRGWSCGEDRGSMLRSPGAAARTWWAWGVCFAFLFPVEILLFILQTLGVMIEIPNQPWGHETFTRVISLTGSQICSGVSGTVTRTLCLCWRCRHSMGVGVAVGRRCWWGWAARVFTKFPGPKREDQVSIQAFASQWDNAWTGI